MQKYTDFFTQWIAAIVAFFTVLFSFIKMFNQSKEIEKIGKKVVAYEVGNSDKVAKLTDRVINLERSVPLQFATHRDYVTQGFMSKVEVEKRFEHMEDSNAKKFSELKALNTERFKKLADDNSEIKKILTDMRSDKIKEQEEEIRRLKDRLGD